MFDLEKALLGWRESQEREASLAPCELDELEDHLRARFDLELELDAALAPATAFAMARHELGEAATLSKEFAKAGRSRWKRLMAAGWMLFAGSFFMPVMDLGWLGIYHGWELVWDVVSGALSFKGLPDLLLMVPNALMLLTLATLRRPPSVLSRWLARLMAGVGTGGLGFGLYALAGGASLEPGFLAWTAALMCAVTALRTRDREWESASPGEVAAS